MRGDARRHAGNTPIEHSASGSITMMQSTSKYPPAEPGAL
jgi:hypothetical protein